jgi:uncharacterized repeat protein (TIGR02543 family)
VRRGFPQGRRQLYGVHGHSGQYRCWRQRQLFRLDFTGTHTFPGANAGYDPQTAKTVAIRNVGKNPTGALVIALSGDNPASFVLNKTSISGIAAGGNDTFTVAPIAMLTGGTYAATVRVSGGHDIEESFNVSFTVVNPVFTVTFDSDGGTPDATTAQTSANNSTVSLPVSDPVKAGHSFDGWYTEMNGGGAEFTAATAVTADTRVYAK